ncbi:16550_t:CDS:2 [Gigaspora rosea]|nr:16550_t:CDS:2 [Gigaspora rosea]
MASDEREVCQSFDGSGNTVLSSQTRHSSENNTHHSFENNMSLTESAELNELNSEALYETTVSDSLNLNLNPSQLEGEIKISYMASSRCTSQEYYSDYHSSEAYLPNLSLHSPAYAFSSSSGPIFNQQDNYYSKLQIEYSNLEVEKKLDRYAMEREFAVRKLRTCTHDDGTVWNATWVCHLSGQWKSKKIIDPDNQRNRDINIANCKWHCNFSISNQATRVRCSLLN